MKKSIFIITGIVIVAILGVIAYSFSSTAPQQQSLPQAINNEAATTTVSVTPLPTASIIGVKLGTVLNGEGLIDTPVTTFDKKDNIYAVLSLQAALAKTQLAYIRTFDGKYVDSKVSHPTQDGMVNFHFSWILNAGKTRKAGNYSLSFFVDGKKAQTVNYTVR